MTRQHSLITGAAGFIGSQLAEKLLAQGHSVIGVDNFDPFYARELKELNLETLKSHPSFSFYEIDIADGSFKTTIKENFELVIHIAAKAGVLPSVKAPSEYVRVNVLGTQNVLELMQEKGCKKLLFASSSSIYGNNKKVPFNENDAVNQPISPYAATKRSCELLNHAFHSLHGFDILNLRFFTVYGPRQRPDLAINKFIRLIDAGQPINMYGDGSSARDYTFVEDTIAGILQAMEYILANTGVFEIVNLGNKNPVKLLDLINTLYELMEKTPQINQLPMQPGDVDVTFADISKAEQLFGYQPKTTIREGLKKYIAWYYEQKEKGAFPVV